MPEEPREVIKQVEVNQRVVELILRVLEIEQEQRTLLTSVEDLKKRDQELVEQLGEAKAGLRDLLAN